MCCALGANRLQLQRKAFCSPSFAVKLRDTVNSPIPADLKTTLERNAHHSRRIRDRRRSAIRRGLNDQGLTIWSKIPPSAKWVFCAFCQPPKTSSMVMSRTWVNWFAYLAAAFSERGR